MMISDDNDDNDDHDGDVGTDDEEEPTEVISARG